MRLRKGEAEIEVVKSKVKKCGRKAMAWITLGSLDDRARGSWFALTTVVRPMLTTDWTSSCFYIKRGVKSRSLPVLLRILLLVAP